ncbi:hypothetical protein [Qipengyuania sp. NPDC077563]|uniref:hypothetical protein n=1 Tax=Qipengyuania sp. NPDC077563 TaxID=3364497 RepID=UPI00384BA6C3
MEYVVKLGAFGLVVCAVLASSGSPVRAQDANPGVSRAKEMEEFVAQSFRQQIALWLSETDLWIADYRQAEKLLGRNLLRNGDANSLLMHRAAIARLECSAQTDDQVDFAKVEALRVEHQQFRQAHRNLLAAIRKIARKPGDRKKPERAIDEPY